MSDRPVSDRPSHCGLTGTEEGEGGFTLFGYLQPNVPKLCEVLADPGLAAGIAAAGPEHAVGRLVAGAYNA